MKYYEEPIRVRVVVLDEDEVILVSTQTTNLQISSEEDLGQRRNSAFCSETRAILLKLFLQCLVQQAEEKMPRCDLPQISPYAGFAS